MLLLSPLTSTQFNKLPSAYMLREDVTVRCRGHVVRVPAAFAYDGASIPRAFWPVVGSPFQPRFMRAALVHDWLHHTHQTSRREADLIFYELLLEDGVSPDTARTMYYAVSVAGGLYWPNDSADQQYLAAIADQLRASGKIPARYGLR